MKVYQAINAVQSDLAKQGIGKGQTNTYDNYKFRGIDDVYNALSPLLARHGLCILPRMVSRACEERQSAKGGALFYVTVEAEFDFVSAEDGSKHTVKTYGEAMDRGDKATNKAMSAAYKYAAFQAFAIPTEGDNDADAVTHEVAAKVIPASFRSSPTMGAMEALDAEARAYVEDLADRVNQLGRGTRWREAVELIEGEKLDDETKPALWSLLDSKTRSALKREQQAMKEAA